MKLLADIQLAPDGGFRGFGKLGLKGDLASNADIVFTNFISTVIGVLTIIAILWFIFQLISGAISIISSGGDKQAVETARKKITHALIGLVIVIISIFIIRLVGYMLGLPDILNFVSLLSVLTGQ